eukprot:SAG11_NODE_1006_length_6209_cov_3.553846_3_plen_339_part_00
MQYSARERVAEHDQLKAKRLQAVEALRGADRMVATLKDKVAHAEEIAEWRMRKLERQLDVKKAIREAEVAAREQLSARLRQEKQREIEALRAQTEQQERTIDDEANLGRSAAGWTPPKSWGSKTEDAAPAPAPSPLAVSSGARPAVAATALAALTGRHGGAKTAAASLASSMVSRNNARRCVCALRPQCGRPSTFASLDVKRAASQSVRSPRALTCRRSLLEKYKDAAPSAVSPAPESSTTPAEITAEKSAGSSRADSHPITSAVNLQMSGIAARTRNPQIVAAAQHAQAMLERETPPRSGIGAGGSGGGADADEEDDFDDDDILLRRLSDDDDILLD